MSRTYRKPAHYREHTEVSFVNYRRYLDRYNNFYWERRRRPAEIIRKELAAAEKKYQQDIEANGGSTIIGYRKSIFTDTEYAVYIRRDIVRRCDYVKIEVTDAEMRNRAVAEYKKLTRDGALSSSSVNKNFKRDCARTNRRDNRNFCNKVMKDEWEDVSEPRYSDTDYKKWVWW